MVKHTKIKFKTLSVSLLIFSFIFSSSISAAEIRIALRANNGEAKGLAKWQATADHLSKKIPRYHFTLVPFENNSALNQAISLGNFHFCITNPASGVEHQIRYGAKPLATLVNKRQGKGYSQFGSVIFTRADRTDINTLQDTKGKMFIAVDELGFGGWRMAWNELLKNDINPYADYTELRFAGGKQQDVVYAVRDKKVAVGSVRTDTLERMAVEGKIKLSDYKVLGAKTTESFPFLHSTELYPEWIFSSASKVDEQLKNKVMLALLSIKADSDAAMKGKYTKWVEPLNYSSVDDLLKELKVGPYNSATMSFVELILLQHLKFILLVLSIIVFLIVIIVYVLRLNKKVLLAKESLKQEMSLSKKLERQLLHSQRIESLGQLTGGIAHDFNNMLASIIGFTELALYADSVKKDKKVNAYLEHVLAASDKCTSLVNQMLTFSRTAADCEIKEELSVSIFISEIYKMLLPLLPKNHNLVLNKIDESLFIHANSSLMTQILMCLYLNAKDSLTKEHSTITLSSERRGFSALDVYCDSCHQDIRGEYIAISVSDDGCGITDEIKSNLFEPFFSTKDIGKGTGMGLSVVHGLTHNHNGHIQVQSSANKGTTITILLPLISHDKKPAASHELSIKVDGKYKSKKILIVDDEISLTTYLKELFYQLGYNVVTFNSSEKALHYFTENSDEVSVVITDQTMPDLTGVEMSDKMYEINNAVPVILCSGYTEDIKDKIKSSANIKECMEKPIHSDKLLKAVNSLLNIN